MNFDGLDQETHERIINAGLEFMAALTAGFGPTVGMEKWDAIAESVGDNFKHEMFVAMLSDRTGNKINLRWKTNDRGNQFFVFIKKIRNATGLGIKEAKDFVDDLTTHVGVVKQIEVKSEHRQSLIAQFREIYNLEVF